MTRSIRAGGDIWSVRVSEELPREGRSALVFLCTSTDQRPYRVVLADPGAVRNDAELDALPEDELARLFEISKSMAYPKTYGS